MLTFEALRAISDYNIVKLGGLIIRIIKTISLLLILLGLQSQASLLALPIEEEHSISLSKVAGELYLVLGHHEHHHEEHAHEHSHHHDSLVNDHEDHMIKLSKSEPQVSSAINTLQSINHLTSGSFISISSTPLPKNCSELILERCRGPSDNFRQLKHSVKFLV